jgi:hypothetical protein
MINSRSRSNTNKYKIVTLRARILLGECAIPRPRMYNVVNVDL